MSHDEFRRTRNIMRIGFFSTIDNPLLAYTLTLAKAHDLDVVVVLDSLVWPEKSHRIWRERTGGAVWSVDGVECSLYSPAVSSIPFHFVASHNGPEAMKLIRELDLHCLYNAGIPRRLSSALLACVPGGVVNVHPGILPHYRGCSAVEWALYNNDPVGNTAHFMNENYDLGPIITSQAYEFEDNSYTSIRTKVYREGCNLAMNVLQDIASQKITPGNATPQNPQEGRYWDPIPDELMARMLEKLSAREYKYLRA